MSAYAGLFSKLKKKNNLTASILNANNFYPKECILFEKRLCFKPKYIHFVYSFLAYVAFSSCLRSEDQFVVAVLVFFFSRGARGHAVVIVNDPFSDLPFFW